MKTFEYNVMRLSPLELPHGKLEIFLKEKGDQGWDLVTVIVLGSTWWYHFKRESHVAE